jgi:hypothetical protein
MSGRGKTRRPLSWRAGSEDYEKSGLSLGGRGEVDKAAAVLAGGVGGLEKSGLSIGGRGGYREKKERDMLASSPRGDFINVIDSA